MAKPTTQIVVLGAGYAGMLFTTRLAARTASKNVHITLVNNSPTFTERLRLHQYAANQPVQWRSIARMLAKTNVTFVEGRVTAINTGQREVAVASWQQTRTIAYDYLVYALGSFTNRDAVPGSAEYAYTLLASGPLSAAALRDHLPDVEQRGGRVIVCGGGATGIETAAEIASVYPRLTVQLITEGQLGMHFGRGVSSYIRRSLSHLGVEIHDETTVTAIHADGVAINQGQTLPCDLCIWTGGFIAPRLARDAGLTVNERNQILVDPFMRALSHPEIYAIGDAAYPQQQPGAPVRMSAVTAAIMGAHGADSLSAVLRGRKPRPLSFAYLGQGIALGRGNAIGFNNYPDDIPRHPYFTGWLGYQARELFVRILAAAPRFELRWPGAFIWPGKRRYAASQKRLGSAAANELPQDQSLQPLLKR